MYSLDYNARAATYKAEWEREVRGLQLAREARNAGTPQGADPVTHPVRFAARARHVVRAVTRPRTA